MPIIRRTAVAQDRIVPSPLLWREVMPDTVTAAHDDVATIGHVDLIEVGDVLYGGKGLLLREGRIHHEPGIAPDYVERMMTHMGLGHAPVRKWLSGILEPGIEIVRIDTPAIVPVHPHWNFGHFLMEILPRLLLLDRECPADWPILLAADAGSFLPGMVRLACPERPVVTFDPLTQAMAAPRLTGCGDMITPRGAVPALRDLYDVLRERLLPLANPEGPAAERVFLSRAGVRKRRHVIVNGPEVEAAVAEAGFLVVRPEDLPWPDQVRLFAGARIVAGEFGSAMHNAIFARPGATIVCLNWINGYQSQIASLMGQRIGYVRPADGRMRDAPGLWTGERTMRFDPREVTERLGSLD